jgi:tetratricopeptide (TPR) repeat protein
VKGIGVLLALLAVAAWPSPVFARKHDDQQGKHDDPRELQGRALFAKGNYDRALEIYATLFAEKGDPIFLRNIGRCYQQLEQPEKSIKSFREYLRRAKPKPDERAEVEGFVREMEELQKQRTTGSTGPSATQPPPAHPAVESTPVVTAPVTITDPTPVASDGEAPGAVLTQPASSNEGASDGESHKSIARRWWFWTGLAVVVAGGAATAYLVTRRPGCPQGTECM